MTAKVLDGAYNKDEIVENSEIEVVVGHEKSFDQASAAMSDKIVADKVISEAGKVACEY